MMTIILCILSFFHLPLIHGDLDQRIAEVTKQIELSPADATLYLQRGDLYLQHEEYDKAIVDFTYCLRHDLKVARVFAGLGDAYNKLHQPDSAIFFIDQVFVYEPENIPALNTKISILESIGKYCEAAHLIENIIERTPTPTPTLYLHLSADWKHCDHQGNIDHSIKALKNGIETLNNNFVLHAQLITLYKSYDRLEEALLYQSKLIERWPSKPRSYLERAEIFIALKNNTKAIADLETAIELIETMAPQKQDLPAIRELKEEMEQLKKETERK